MTNPFQYNEYRRFLNDICASEHAPRGYRAALARSAECQAAYLSQVLREKAHLTEDQLLGIGNFLELKLPEIEFLMLLMRHEKAGTPKLKKYLNSSIEKLRREQLNLKNWLDADSLNLSHEILLQYLSTWIPSTVHLLTSSPEFCTPAKIAQRLSLTQDKVSETLFFLEKYGFVEREGSQWKFKSGSKHLEKDSPLQHLLQVGRRELVSRSLTQGSPASMHFSSVFTLSEKDLMEIKDVMTRSIERSHNLIQASGTEKLACICIDVFEVI
jgi:DNA-binding MarR family transcriptional regulator